ncbi:hypothetical protein BDK51DRAFT_50282 [Blyttiomyces helicus]|uniref:Uncharacterized protein n=1 Tax=Blyttiomyces helicus TaxID=388810 RepID=A0A4P9WFF2_9FUNG|nr:hypothetical protein BDK51DRAFT_50282 [Blyttiomyces helicus]|eukprot:RKO91471.1 hypothetical protein BDK51DRAFT_50282 [Blyttiomyces helicus]
MSSPLPTYSHGGALAPSPECFFYVGLEISVDNTGTFLTVSGSGARAHFSSIEPALLFSPGAWNNLECLSSSPCSFPIRAADSARRWPLPPPPAAPPSQFSSVPSAYHHQHPLPLQTCGLSSGRSSQTGPQWARFLSPTCSPAPRAVMHPSLRHTHKFYPVHFPSLYIPLSPSYHSSAMPPGGAGVAEHSERNKVRMPPPSELEGVEGIVQGGGQRCDGVGHGCRGQGVRGVCKERRDESVGARGGEGRGLCRVSGCTWELDGADHSSERAAAPDVQGPGPWGLRGGFD